MTDGVLVFNTDARRPACPLLAAALGGNPSFAHHFDSETWIVGSAEGMRRFGPLSHGEVREIATRLGRTARLAREDETNGVP